MWNAPLDAGGEFRYPRAARRKPRGFRRLWREPNIAFLPHRSRSAARRARVGAAMTLGDHGPVARGQG